MIIIMRRRIEGGDIFLRLVHGCTVRDDLGPPGELHVDAVGFIVAFTYLSHTHTHMRDGIEPMTPDSHCLGDRRFTRNRCHVKVSMESMSFL